jgi:hypothetical protein
LEIIGAEIKVSCRRRFELLIDKNTSLKSLSHGHSLPQKAIDTDNNTHPPTTPEP